MKIDLGKLVINLFDRSMYFMHNSEILNELCENNKFQFIWVNDDNVIIIDKIKPPPTYFISIPRKSIDIGIFGEIFFESPEIELAFKLAY